MLRDWSSVRWNGKSKFCRINLVISCLLLDINRTTPSRQYKIRWSYLSANYSKFKISILVFLFFQPIIPKLSKTISWRLGDPQCNDLYLSVIIIERGSSTLYDCWQWLPTGGNINQWVLIDETLCCCCVLWLVNDFVINTVLCSLNIHCSFSSIQCSMLGF